MILTKKWNWTRAAVAAGIVLSLASCTRGGASGRGAGSNPNQNTMPGAPGKTSSGSMDFSMPMMREDPRSIKSVEGVIEEIRPGQIIVHTKKNVSLIFQEDENTQVLPAGKKPAVGMNVKIEIDHLPRGMRAAKIEIL